jgi:hypothetical protein
MTFKWGERPGSPLYFTKAESDARTESYKRQEIAYGHGLGTIDGPLLRDASFQIRLQHLRM